MREGLPQVPCTAESLTRSNKLFYIGHSWGAQAGWYTLHEKNLADAFVSLETTIEFKTDTNELNHHFNQYAGIMFLKLKINELGSNYFIIWSFAAR